MAQEIAGAPPQASPCCKPGAADCREYSDAGPDLRVALVVGVDDYGAPGPSQDRLTNLENAKNDARQVAGILSDSYVVRCILDADAGTFKKELKKLKDFLGPLHDDSSRDFDNSSVIVHFSGHGFRDKTADFILLSGNFATKQQALEAAVPVFQVSDALEGLIRLDIYLVFDSCRNRSDGQLTKPDWINGFGDPRPYTKHGHTIVFSAAENQFAFDKQESIGAKDNGALIFTLSKYFKFPGMLLREVYETSIEDPSMLEIGQRPSVGPGRVFLPAPWSAHQQICSASEAVIARKMIGCRMSGGTTCIENRVCNGELRKFDQLIENNGGPSSNCSRKKLFDVFTELGAKCEAAIASSSLIAAPASAAIDRVHLNVLLSDSATRIADNRALRELYATADRPTVSRSPASQARDFLAVQRRIVTARDGFSGEATAKLKVLDKSIELKLRPSSNAGTTGRLKPSGKPLVDCDEHPCSPDWVFVRVPTEKGNVDGWLPPSKIAIAQPSQTITVEFRGEEFEASQQGRKTIRGLADTIRSSTAAEITTIVPVQATPQARALAAARLAYVQNMLGGVLRIATSQHAHTSDRRCPGDRGGDHPAFQTVTGGGQ